MIAEQKQEDVPEKEALAYFKGRDDERSRHPDQEAIKVIANCKECRRGHEKELIETHNNAINKCIDIVWFTDFGLPSHKDYKFNEDRKKCDLCKLFVEMKKEMLKQKRVFGGERKQQL